MWLSSLTIQNVRNLKSIEFTFNAGFNVIWGDNGSGKTSVLEAIHVLSAGRSFKTGKINEIINLNEPILRITGKIAREKAVFFVGTERGRQKEVKIHLNGQACSSIVEVAKLIPVQIVNAESFNLLEAGPEARRQFLDWGVFHVEHNFLPVWQKFKRVLSQRNAALKRLRSEISESFVFWDQELCQTASLIDAYRRQYLEKLTPIVQRIVTQLLDKSQIEVSYQQGWREGVALSTALKESMERDKIRGYTGLGPHRANLEWCWEGIPLKALLSRGQAKIFVCALLLARAELLKQELRPLGIFLIDDITAELDKAASQRLVSELSLLRGQVIITGIEGKALNSLVEDHNADIFHLIEGQLNPS